MKNVIFLLSLMPLLVLDLGCKTKSPIDTQTNPPAPPVDTRTYLEIQKDVMQTLLSSSKDDRTKKFDLNNKDIKTWPGVKEVNAEGHITKLMLWKKSLTGPIPADIGKLTSLQELNLGSNELTRSIPAEIGQLRKLRVIFLNHNKLTGTVPAEIGQHIVVWDPQN